VAAKVAQIAKVNAEQLASASAPRAVVQGAGQGEARGPEGDA
jgi:hypothetical protein